MSRQILNQCYRYCWLALALAAWPVAGSAQIAVADVEEIEEMPTISASELETLVGPIALYPDDLLAVVLPASAFPLQIVEAARFLEDLENDSSLKPDEDWDDSVVALLNYPEIVELLNEDLDWTWRLGEAVVAQQSDVIAAIELFRDRAYAAGNLKSDDYQLVATKDGAIQITPVQDDVIYVPYYEPARVVVYQPRPVYYYYPRAYPVYYYPYSSNHMFHDSFFWGVTTAFSIGWHSHHLNVFHHSYYGHPYYGHSYWDNWWYRRPDIHVHNNVYARNSVNVSYNRYRDGDRWQPRVRRTVRESDQRVTRTRYYPKSDSGTVLTPQTSGSTSTRSTPNVKRSISDQRNLDSEKLREERAQVQFRERQSKARRSTTVKTTTAPRTTPEREPAIRASQPRQSQVRQSQPRQYQPKATQSRQAEPQPQVRQSQPRQAQVRQSAPRQQSQPKASSERQSQPRQQAQPKASSQSQSQPRQQSQPKASSQRQSQPKQSQSAPNRSSSSNRASRSSSSRKSESRSSRRDN